MFDLQTVNILGDCNFQTQNTHLRVSTRSSIPKHNYCHCHLDSEQVGRYKTIGCFQFEYQIWQTEFFDGNSSFPCTKKYLTPDFCVMRCSARGMRFAAIRVGRVLNLIHACGEHLYHQLLSDTNICLVNFFVLLE